MQVAIVGLPNVGKSTLFNALTRSYGAEVANFPFCTIDPNVGRVNVRDDRLTQLSDTVHAARIIPATIEYVDVAGLVAGASRGEGLGNKFLAHIRQTDAIVQVVRAFDDADVHHVAGAVDPQRDRETIETELILADIDTLDRRMNENGRKARSGDRDCQKRQDVYERLRAHLDSGRIGYTLDLTDDERGLLSDLFLLSMKPFVYAVNVRETELLRPVAEYRAMLGLTDDTRVPVVPISARLELDMMDFSEEERTEYLASLDITVNPVDTLIKTCYDAVGLLYYFTVGEIEARAWTVRRGACAPEAAGVIHTDFEKKFIKAEVANWKDLVDMGGWARAREGGKVRMEGKDYVVSDGDVITFKVGG